MSLLESLGIDLKWRLPQPEPVLCSRENGTGFCLLAGLHAISACPNAQYLSKRLPDHLFVNYIRYLVPLSLCACGYLSAWYQVPVPGTYLPPSCPLL
jgi:hypothetical protein